MKKRFAQWLVLAAKLLYPEIRVKNAHVVEDYEAKKIGITYVVSKKDIKECRYNDGKKVSLRERKRNILKEVCKNIRLNIIGAIDRNSLIEYSVQKENGDLIISGELKVYVPKKSETNQIKKRGESISV